MFIQLRQPPSAKVAANASVVKLGAADADWNARHTGARYTQVQHANGHVTSYTMSLHPGISIINAKAQALKEFPADVVIAWFSVQDICAQMSVHSTTLGKTLSASGYKDPKGYALIQFDTAQQDGTASYDPKNINEILLSASVFEQTSDAPPC